MDIQEGMRKAYKEAGHNAYFGDGFRDGIKFAEVTGQWKEKLTAFMEALEVQHIEEGLAKNTVEDFRLLGLMMAQQIKDIIREKSDEKAR
jgi:hypothetical protein